jgi:hypothetical protein
MKWKEVRRRNVSIPEIEYWVKCMPRRLDDKDYYSLVAEIDLMLEPILIKDALRISAGLP